MSAPTSLLAVPASTSTSTSSQIRAIYEENAVLKTLLADFKEQLGCGDPKPKVHRPEFVEKYEKTSKRSPRSVAQGAHGQNEQGRSKPKGKATLVSSISHPAILWKELQSEQKRAAVYQREAGHFKEKFERLNTGDVVEKMRGKVMELTAMVAELTTENRALTSIQLHQERQLLSEDVLEKEWPVQMAVLRQDLDVAKEAGLREQRKASELRRKGRAQWSEIEALKETNKTLKDIQPVSVDEVEEKSLRLIQSVEGDLASSRSEGAAFRKSAASFQQLCKREIAFERAKGRKKDEEIEDLKRQLTQAQVDARQNILNMKEIKRTLGGIAVGNMKLKEVASLLPQGGEISVMDLTAIETILPEEIDTARTKFLSPRPPTSEIVNCLRYKPGGASRKKKNMNQTSIV